VLVLPTCEEANTVALAATGHPIRKSVDELRAAALALKAETGLDLAPLVERAYSLNHLVTSL
jgi:hypothetical protein